MRLTLLAIAGLLLAGCSQNSSAVVDGDPFNTPAAPQIVFVWNGKKCIEATKSPKQLSTMSRLTFSSVLSGQWEKAEIWVDQTHLASLDEIKAKGGSIELPNGRTVMLPGRDSGSGIVANGQLTYENGQTFPVSPAIPDGTKLDTVTFDRSELANLQDLPPDKAEWWKAATGNLDDPRLAIPPKTSANSRVGSVSMSNGTGQVR